MTNDGWLMFVKTVWFLGALWWLLIVGMGLWQWKKSHFKKWHWRNHRSILIHFVMSTVVVLSFAMLVQQAQIQDQKATAIMTNLIARRDRLNATVQRLQRQREQLLDQHSSLKKLAVVDDQLITKTNQLTVAQWLVDHPQ